jgi:hypothetical protein
LVTTLPGRSAADYDPLEATAIERVTLPYDEPSEDALWAAGQWVAERSDLLVACWDGQPSRGIGGTADVVQYALRHNRLIRVLWPLGVEQENAA